MKKIIILTIVLLMYSCKTTKRVEVNKLFPLKNLIKTDTSNNLWQGIPGVEVTKKGRVFVAWYSGGKEEPTPQNEVYVAISDDKGKTFTKPHIVAGPKNDARAFDPTLWIDPQNRLWYIFNRGNKVDGVHDVYARICNKPDAKILDWLPEFRVGYDVAYAFRMNKITVLSTGEWLMPVTHASEKITTWFGGDKQVQGVGISNDKGKTWKLYGNLKAPKWALENMIVELKNKKLWMLMRTGSGYLWESFSKDKGKTWSKAKQSNIKSPGSRFFITRLVSGNLLLINHYKYTKRSHLTAKISKDDGVTWSEGLLLDQRNKVSYPDAKQDKNGLIWAVHDRNRYGVGEVLLSRFTEKDILAGKNVSGKMQLKQIVSKLNKPIK